MGGIGDPEISQLPVSLAPAGVFRVLVFRHFWNRDNWEISGPVNPCGLLANRRKTPLSHSILSLKMWAFWFAYICLKQKSILRAVRGCLCTVLVIAQEREKTIQGRCRGGYFLLLILVASCLSQKTMGTKLGCLNLSVLVVISNGSERNGWEMPIFKMF